MEEVEDFFNSLGLGEYIPSCEYNGYDHLGCILEHDDEDLDILASHVGMRPGHLFLLKQAVRQMNGPQTGVPIVARVPIIEFNGPVGTGGPVAGAATAAAATAPAVAAAAAAATATATETLPTKRKAQDHVLPQFCRTTKEVKIESLRHSTALGHSAMRDNKSSGRRIVYRCTSVLSKKVKKEMGPAVAGGGEEFKCPHCLVWNYTKKIGGGGFKLNQADSVLGHAPHCVAPQRVTRAELLHDAAFVKHAINKLDSTGKEAAKTAVGRGGRLDGSVKSRTAKRASNDVKRFHDKDYEEDWSKIRPWGEEYERLNNGPGRSRFDMMVDEENRSVSH